MRRKMRLVLLLLLALTLSACNITKADSVSDDKEEYEYKLPSFEKDFVKVFASHADYTFGENNCFRNMLFTIISSYEITEEDEITVTFDPYVSCKAVVDISYTETLPFEVFEAYQGEAWTQYAEKTGCELYELKNIYDENIDKMPILYSAVLSVTSTDTRYTDQQISSMTISLNGKETTYDFSNLIFTSEKIENKNDSFLINDTLALSDLNYREVLEDDTEAKLYLLERLQFTATDSVKIKRIYFLNHEEIEILRVSVQADNMTYLWDEENPLELVKDEAVTLNITVQDDATREYGSFNRMLIVEYEANGEIYNLNIDVSLRIRDNAFKMLYEEGVL